jgi:hypothetical protein
MGNLQSKYEVLLQEYELLEDDDPKKRFVYRQLESMSKAIAHYSSPQYLNRRPILREIVNAEKTIETAEDVKNVFGLQ